MRRKARKFAFTKLRIESLCSTETRDTYYDTKIVGLGIMIFRSGKKTYFLYTRDAYRPIKVKLGSFSEMTVEEARAKAVHVKNQIGNGINPIEAKRQVRAQITFGELFDRYMEEYAKVHKKSWREDESMNQHFFQGYRTKRLHEISSRMLSELHRKIGTERGKRRANYTIDIIRGVYNKAIQWELFSGQNPARNVTKYRLQSRERFLLPHELPKFFEALNTEKNHTIRDFIWLSLLTGARRSNVQAMRWDELDLTNGLWRIPMTKNGTSQLVPVVGKAIDILLVRKEKATSEWVFPGRKSKSGHLQEPKAAWANVLKRAGITNLRIHDLRRSMGSYLAATGANSFVIGKALNHQSISSTAIYARLSVEPVRLAVEKATESMLGS